MYLALKAVLIKNEKKIVSQPSLAIPFLQWVYIAKYKLKRFHKQFAIIYSISLLLSLSILCNIGEKIAGCYLELLPKASGMLCILVMGTLAEITVGTLGSTRSDESLQRLLFTSDQLCKILGTNTPAHYSYVLGIFIQNHSEKTSMKQGCEVTSFKNFSRVTKNIWGPKPTFCYPHTVPSTMET